VDFARGGPRSCHGRATVGHQLVGVHHLGRFRALGHPGEELCERIVTSVLFLDGGDGLAAKRREFLDLLGEELAEIGTEQMVGRLAPADLEELAHVVSELERVGVTSLPVALEGPQDDALEVFRVPVEELGRRCDLLFGDRGQRPDL